MGGGETRAASLERLPMTPLIILAVTFVLLWVLFILPQQRRVRAHQALVASVEPGDEVVLSAGIHGRIVDLGAEDMTLEVAPGVVLRVARQAILRRTEDALGAEPTDTALDEPGTPASDADGPAPSDPGTNV
jgi:preprotein translocase subunit YajC